MALTRAKRDIDWEVESVVSIPIAVSRSWEVTSTFNNPSTSDQNRYALIAVANEDSGGGAQVSSISVGGELATRVEGAFVATTFSDEVVLYSLTESQLNSLGTSETISVIFTSTPDSFTIASAIYSNVLQSSPIVGVGTMSQASGSPMVSVSASAEDDGVSVYAFTDGTVTTVTSISPGFNEVADITTPSSGGNTALVFEKIPSVAPVETVDITVTTTLRLAAVLANLRSA